MSSPLQLLLVRHGQSEANAGLSSDPDSALTSLGREQSLAVGKELAAIDLRDFVGRVSPYRRARETARAITEMAGFAFEVDERIREWGETANVDGREYPSESLDQVITRLRAFLAAFHDRNLLLVSHATPISLMDELFRGQTLSTTGSFWERVPNARLIRANLEWR